MVELVCATGCAHFQWCASFICFTNWSSIEGGLLVTVGYGVIFCFQSYPILRVACNYDEFETQHLPACS